MRRLLLVVPWVILALLVAQSAVFAMSPSDALAGLTPTLNAIVNIAIEAFKGVIDAYGQYLASS